MARLSDKDIDEILSTQKPGFRRVKRLTPEEHAALPSHSTPDLTTLQQKAVDIAEGKDVRAASSSAAADDTSELLKRFLGQSTELDAPVGPESDETIRAADIDIVQLRPIDSDAQEGPVRPSVVISRSTKKIIAETG
jgi:hypothetical protein